MMSRQEIANNFWPMATVFVIGGITIIGIAASNPEAARMREENNTSLLRQFLPDFSQQSGDDNTTYGAADSQLQNELIISGDDSCVAINTDDWGFPEYYDPSIPEIRTAYEAIAALGVDAQTGNVYVRQGDEVKPFNSNDVFANRSKFCVTK